MQSIQILGNFSRNFHEQGGGDVTLTKENYHHVNYDPVVLQNHIIRYESFLVLWVHEMINRESYQNASDEELDITNETLSWGPLDTVDIQLSVHLNVP